MLNITIIAIDKVKKSYFKDAIAEYAKRLSPYARINVVELPAMSFNDSNKLEVKKKECEALIKQIERAEDSLVVALTEGGKEFDSPKFSEYIDKQPSKIIFVIGGSLGFTDGFLKKVNTKLSLSQLTFPHELARLVLFEQLYRAVMIAKNKNYHH